MAKARVAKVKTQEELPIIVSTKPYYGEIKRIERPRMTVDAGWFTVVLREDAGNLTTNNWEHCRERFHMQNAQATQILFSHAANQGERVADFINAVETRLEHQKITVCGPTDWNRATWIIPAAFWWHKPMRRSLFTALLRAGTAYDPARDNFEEALWSNEYTRSTKAAVEYFLAGNTWSKNDGGWYENFRGVRREEDLKKYLTKKPISDKALWAFALEQLELPDRDALIAEYRKAKYSHAEAD